MRSRVRGVVVFAVAVLLFMPAAAQSNTTAPSQQKNAQAANGGAKYDADIRNQVSQELSKHDAYKNVHATVEDGMVSLQGTVPTYRDKMNLLRRVDGKDHVQGIRDLVRVAGKTVPDQQLRDQLAEKLRYDRIDQGIMFNNFNLAVNNGVVTIGGQARTPTDADSALSIVENTPGVKGVVDDIKVLPTSPMDDETRLRVARAIYSAPGMTKYAMDPEAPIRIIVNNGHVTLYGVVQSQMDKQIADVRAKSVPNVFSVTDNLVVASQQPK